MKSSEVVGRSGPAFDNLAVGDVVCFTTDNGNFLSGPVTKVNRVTAIVDRREWLRIRPRNIEMIERKIDGDWFVIWAREDD